MKNTFLSFSKLIAVAACALSLGSCNRAEYAMLPKGASYHGVTRVATPVPAKPEIMAAEAPAAPATVAAPEVAVAPPATAAPTAKAVERNPATRVAAKAPEGILSEDAALVAATVATLPQSQAAPKPTRVQKFAATRLVRTVAKLSGVSQVKQTLETARTQKLSGNLRTGVILLLIGLLISLFSGINRVFGFIGGVIAIIGLIFIVLYLLDNL
ncbi:MAG: hypothetical protein JWR44_453 [Hymenobacter sp.]|jgi:hypothetical protein|nr:hypothetical protein [Hymenobacter sp.]